MTGSGAQNKSYPRARPGAAGATRAPPPRVPAALPPLPSDPDWQRARALVLAHGWNAVAYQILNPGIRHWFAAAGDAVVGYATYAGMRVVAGAPQVRVDGRTVTGGWDHFGADPAP